MILADSSIWIDHLRSNDAKLQELLENEEIVIHPFVIGELSLGHIPRYDDIMKMLSDLPVIARADDGEVRHLIRSRKLFGTGIGYVDAHLLASVMISSSGSATGGSIALPRPSGAMRRSSCTSAQTSTPHKAVSSLSP